MIFVSLFNKYTLEHQPKFYTIPHKINKILLFGNCCSICICIYRFNEAIKAVLEIEGTEKDGEYKITIPQHALNVEVDEFKIIPPMSLGSWTAFTAAKEGGAMLMGDIVLGEEELDPVQQEVIRQGLSITALHNHMVRNSPNYMYMHIGGIGALPFISPDLKHVSFLL